MISSRSFEALQKVVQGPLAEWFAANAGDVERAMIRAKKALQDRTDDVVWFVTRGTLRLRFPGYGYDQLVPVKNGLSRSDFRFRKDDYRTYWAEIVPTDKTLDAIASEDENFAKLVEKYGDIWKAIGKGSPATASTDDRRPEGTYEVLKSGFVKLFLDRPWKRPDDVDPIVIGKKTEDGRYYWLFKQKRATNLIAPALKRSGFPGMAAKLAKDFAGVAESLEDTDQNCNPLRDMAAAAGPDDVHSPIGKAIVEDVTETLARRLPVGMKLHDYQRVGVAFAKLNGYRALIADEPGLGKAQSLNAKILTPEGWKKMGDIRVGDKVVDPDTGRHATVTGVYPQGERDVFDVITSDGGRTRCCDEHLWHVYTKNDRARRSPGRVLMLRDFMHKLKTVDSNGWGARHWFLPVTQPVVYPEGADLPLKPYLFGALLGDGSFRHNTPSISKPDTALIDRVRSELPPDVRLQKQPEDEGGWSITADAVRGPRNANPVTEVLRGFGLWGLYSEEKFIPVEYAHASVEDRVELLRGLMDTDGDCTKDGTATFNTSSPRLRDDVVDLVRALGGFTTVSTRPAPKYTHKGETRVGQPAYRVNVRLPFNPFWLPRKAERWTEPNMARSIDDVVPAGREPVQCIAVDSKRHLYITDDYIVTHNTIQGIAAIAMDPDKLLPAVVIAPTIVFFNWAKELKKWLPSVPVHLMPKRDSEPPPKGWKGVIVTKTSVIAWQTERLIRFGPQFLIVDEAQDFRNENKQSDALDNLASHTPHVIELSGTPFKNNLMELRRLLDILDKEQFGKKSEFGERYTKARDKQIKGGRIVREYKDSQNEDELRERLGCLMIRREKKQVAKWLPPKTHRSLSVDIEPADMREYRKADKEFEKWLREEFERRLREEMEAAGAEGEVSRSEIEQRVLKALSSQSLTKLTYLRRLVEKAKAKPAVEYLTQAARNGVPALAFTNYPEVAEEVAAGLEAEGVRVALVVGDVAAKDRQEVNDLFEAGKLDVVIGSKALIVGASYPRAQEVVFIGRFWTPADEMQAEDRGHRITSKNPLLITFLHVDETVDDRVRTILDVKRKLMEKVLGTEKLKVASGDTTADVLADFLGTRPKMQIEAEMRQNRGRRRRGREITRGSVFCLSFDAGRWNRKTATRWATINGWTPKTFRKIEGRWVAEVGEVVRGARYRPVRLAPGVRGIVPT